MCYYMLNTALWNVSSAANTRGWPGIVQRSTRFFPVTFGVFYQCAFDVLSVSKPPEVGFPGGHADTIVHRHDM